MSNTTTQPPPDAPRYALGWAALAYVLAVLALGYPALKGAFLISSISDQYLGGFPVRDFAAQSLKAGIGVPLWNPYLFGGMPYIAAMGVGDVFYPTAALRVLFPVDFGMTLGFMIHTVLAGVFMYVFLRAVGLSFLASLIGGAAFMLGGPVASYVSPGHDGKLFVSALLPMFMTLLLRGVREGRAWTWGALAIVTGLAVLSPHPQLLQYMLLTGGCFALYLAFSEHDGVRLDRKVALTRIAYALGAVLLGGAMGAIQYSSVPEYVGFSPRAGGTAYEFATSYSFPIEELVNMYLPEFTGILDNYWGRNGIHFHSEYIGVAVLFLASAGAWASGKALGLTRSFKLFMLGVLTVSLLWALGGNTPFYQLVYILVPGTKFFRAPSTIIFVTAFAIAFFAALGAERAMSGSVSRRFVLIWGGAAAFFTLLGVTGGLTNLGSSIATSLGTATAAARGGNVQDYIGFFVERVERNGGAVVLGSVRSLFFLLLTLAVAWGAAQRWMTARVAGLVLLAIVAVDLWSVERRYWRFSPRANVLYGSDATIDYLKQRRDSARVWVLPQRASRDAMLGYDGLMVHGVRQLEGYHGNHIARYEHLVNALQAPMRDTMPRPANPGLMSLLNVQYLLTDVPPTEPMITRLFPAATLAAGPARNATGNMVYLYKLPGDNPPAVVASTATKAPDDVALATLGDARFNDVMQRRVALVDTSSATKALSNLNALPAPSTIAARVSRPTHSRILVDLSAPAQDGNMLIVSENFYPGWTAKVDGRDTSVERANYALIGVPLTAGARRVELEFTSGSYANGKMTTIAALAVAVGLILAGLIVGGRGRVAVAEAG